MVLAARRGGKDLIKALGLGGGNFARQGVQRKAVWLGGGGLGVGTRKFMKHRGEKQVNEGTLASGVTLGRVKPKENFASLAAKGWFKETNSPE